VPLDLGPQEARLIVIGPLPPSSKQASTIPTESQTALARNSRQSNIEKSPN